MAPFTQATAALVALAALGSQENAALGFTTYSSPISSKPTSRFSSSFSTISPSRIGNSQSHNVAFIPKSNRNTIRMLVQPGGRDALVELATTDSPYSKTVRKTPSKVRKIASLASVPAAALAGFVATPSRRIIAHGVGGAIAGLAGVVTKSRLDIETEAAAKPALAQLLLDHELNDPDLPALVQQLKEDYAVDDDDFMEIATDVYGRYLMAMVKNPQCSHKEVAELTTLSSALALDNIAIGEAHAEAAREVYRTTCLWTPEEELEDPEHPDRMSLDKFLFLTERAFRQNGETDEAFKFEFSRVCKAFNITEYTGMGRVADVAEPFYQRALDTTRVKLDTGAVGPEMLARARATLGLSERVANDMHISTYADEVRSLLGLETEGVEPATSHFPEGASERLANLREVLGISEEDASYELSVEVTPLLQATAASALKDATAAAVGNATDAPDAAGLWKRIAARQEELCLSDESMTPLLDSVVIQTLGTPLEEASTFASVNNEAGVYDKLLEAVDVKNAVSDLLRHSSSANVTDGMDRYYDMDSHSAAFAFMGPDMRKKMYQMFLTRAIRDGAGDSDTKGMTPEMESKLKEVQLVLGVDDDSAEDVTTIVCGPLVEEALKVSADEMTGDDSTPELLQNFKARNEELIANLKVPADLVSRYSHDIYKNYLRFVQENTPSGIPSAEFAEKLASLRELFSLDESETNPMQVATFGSTYKKSVLEAMGSTGVILPEYREALEKLRVRLGVGVDAAAELFKDAVSEKIVPMVKRIEAEMERTMLTKEQLAQKRGQDMGEDVFKGGRGPLGQLGIGTKGNIMGDIVNLVDFYTENDIPEKKQVGTKTAEHKVPAEGGEGEEGEEEKTVTEEEPVYETTFPITALGVKAIEPEMADAMYRQFVVGGFTTQGKQAARYEKAAPVFGGILGLSKEAMEEINGSVGSSVYENFIENALKTKSALDQQDMMFLANIQTKLNLPSDQAEQMMVDAQKKVLKEQVQKLFDSEHVFATDVKAFRERCNAMGVDIAGDLGITKNQVAALFAMEVTEGIEKGQITPESGEQLTEIQESLGLTPEECEKTLEGLVTGRVEQAVDRIDKELMRGRQASCIEHIRTLLKFAAFVGGDLDLNVGEERANKIVSIFGASDFGDATSEAIDMQMELLKTCLGLK